MEVQKIITSTLFCILMEVQKIITSTLFCILSLANVVISQDTTCLSPEYEDQITPQYLETSMLYVYNHVALPSLCSGTIDEVELCYVRRQGMAVTEEFLTVATLLVLGRDSLVVRAVMPFTVSTMSCDDDDDTPLANGAGDRMCCVTRPLPPFLGLRASEGAPLEFRFALQTPDNPGGLGLRGYQERVAYGFTADPSEEMVVGDEIELPSASFNSTIMMALISFVVEADMCEVLTSDPTVTDLDLDFMGEGVLYVYTHVNLPSTCSGDINAVRLCYVRRPAEETDEQTSLGTLLVLSGDQSLTIREAIPFTVSSTTCETDDIPSGTNIICCVTRYVDPSLGLRANRGQVLDFQFALETADNFGALSLVGHLDARVQGLRLQPLCRHQVGSRIALMEAQNQTVTAGVISFIVEANEMELPEDEDDITQTRQTPEVETTTGGEDTAPQQSTDSTILETSASAPTDSVTPVLTSRGSSPDLVVGMVTLGVIAVVLMAICVALAILVVLLLCKLRQFQSKNTSDPRYHQVSRRGHMHPALSPLSTTNPTVLAEYDALSPTSTTNPIVLAEYAALDRTTASKPNTYEDIDQFDGARCRGTNSPPKIATSMTYNPLYAS